MSTALNYKIQMGIPFDGHPPTVLDDVTPPASTDAGLGIDWNSADEVNDLLRGEVSDLFLIRRNLKRKREQREATYDVLNQLFLTRCLQDQQRIDSFKGPGTPFDPWEGLDRDPVRNRPSVTNVVPFGRHHHYAAE